ncbi:hypothetical protein GE191_13155 [Serratia fonticola]|nr:hypothetical protein [Serratia fonticola]
MKLKDMPNDVQERVATLLCKELNESGTLHEVGRTEKAKVIATSIREAFEELYDDTIPNQVRETGRCDAGVGLEGGNKMSVLIPSLTESELATLMWTVNALVSAEVRSLRSEVYQLLLASQK